MTKSPLDLATLRARLHGARGREYWRSLEELADTAEFRDLLEQEFPQHSEAWDRPVNRRQVLQVMAASLGLAGLTACTQPVHKIVPYVTPPEEVVPGKPLFFATAFQQSGVAQGLLVESHMGRPTKIEGNPDHPASLGATDAVAQASLLTMYDPDRSQAVVRLGNISSWISLQAMLESEREAKKESQGAGLRVLTETVTSPTLAAQLRELLRQFPSARWHSYEPAGCDNVRAGSLLAFGEAVNTYYRFDRADVVLSLDADFLHAGPGCVRYTHDYIARRQAGIERGEMNRLYVVETTPTSTGAMADHRLALRACEMEAFAWALAEAVGAEKQAPALPPMVQARARWIAALARDLRKRPGASIVLAGPEQPPVVHALAHKINHALGNLDQTVFHTAPLEADPMDQAPASGGLAELVADMRAGKVDLLFILGGNPVYYAPADLNFVENLHKVRLAVHLGLYQDETAWLCHWHVPEAHYLEAWSDTRAYDGTISIIQPLIAPLYSGNSAHELLAAFIEARRSGYDIVRDYWKAQWQAGARAGQPALAANFEAWWRKALHDGFIAGSALPPKPVKLKAEPLEASPPPPESMELVFRPDPNIGDGRYANNGWLQELPKPVTKLTWDNAAYVSPATAQHLGVESTDVVELRLDGRSVRAPVWIVPGQAGNSITVHLGYGRARAGRVGNGAGFNAYRLRSSSAPWFSTGIAVGKTGERYPLVVTQDHSSMEGRDIVRAADLEEYRKDPRLFEKEEEPAPPPGLSLYPEWKHEGYAWGMAVDLTRCVGCNACVVACQAENNIPVVGKDQVAVSREMHWIRVDRYYKGPANDPETYFQPVMCQHCENAPCEVVCPVAATTHSPEGLNEMVYNRCVGTRYCSNNCPYKVRRFNFLAYSDWGEPSLKLMHNPNVTVRSRGVMEKCTYCVQRINRAKIEAEKEDRQVRDGDLQTACQQACPAGAIVFGNLNDPNSRVSKLKAGPLNYGLLAGLNTRPRTSYLARLRNPNPEIAREGA